MLKKVIALVLGLVPVFLLINIIRAQQSDFSVDANVTYDVQDSGITTVIHHITLVNNSDGLYATTYSLSLENIDVQNVSATDSSGSPIQTDVQKSGNTTTIKATFSNAVVGKGSVRHFSISYDNGSFAVRTGEIWEVSIPRLSDQTSFRSYDVTLQIPASFGLEAYISPTPEISNQDSSGRTYTFTKSDVTQTGITAGFGQFQVFSFNLTYHLGNPSDFCVNNICTIALPPDTAYQKVYLQSIDPKPTNVTVDSEGNWLATYDLSSRQRVDVTVTGSVQIFASYRSFTKPSDQVLSDDLKATDKYWQVNDPKIQALAAQLKTPEAIYDYVSTTLKYDFARVQPNVTRLGAVGALENPTEAICTEYTDLFIAIARAAGIPAREIEGYAYTENPQLQPLSLVADVLHAWPEYYDKDKGSWIPVDPTWGSTSGIDYFNKLDLRHFAFVIHGDTNPGGGESDTMPFSPGSYKLGTNPQKDVYVSFGQLPDVRISTPDVSITPVRTLPLLSLLYSLKVVNPGPIALYNIYPTVFFDSVEKSRDFVSVLPPYANYQSEIDVPFSILGKNTPNIIEVSIGASSAQISTNKTQVVVTSLLILSAALILIILGILLKLKKIKVGRIFGKIVSVPKNIYARFTKKSTQDPNNPKSI